MNKKANHTQEEWLHYIHVYKRWIDEIPAVGFFASDIKELINIVFDKERKKEDDI